MAGLDALTEEDRSELLEQARYRVALKHPLFGVLPMLLGMGVPGGVAVTLMLMEHRFFISSVYHQLLFILILAVTVGVAVTISNIIRRRTIVAEAEVMLQERAA